MCSKPHDFARAEAILPDVNLGKLSTGDFVDRGTGNYYLESFEVGEDVGEDGSQPMGREICRWKSQRHDVEHTCMNELWQVCTRGCESVDSQSVECRGIRTKVILVMIRAVRMSFPIIPPGTRWTRCGRRIGQSGDQCDTVL